MARLTVEDCLATGLNRYDLVMLASKRARDLSMGTEALIDEDNDKPTVVALREIAQKLITNENVDTIGKPVIEDEFAEPGHIEFPLPE